MDVARKRKPDFADQLMDALEGQGPFTQELAWAAADRIRELGLWKNWPIPLKLRS